MNNVAAQQPFRVLALDGGGMRGLYTASLLRAIARLIDARFVQHEPDIGKGFDLICGTSTGAILACALAAGVPLQRVCKLYSEYGQSIFPSPMPKPNERLRMVWWLWKHLCQPSSSSDNLKSRLEEIFGELTLDQLYRKRGIALCIPTVDALHYRSWVFKTPHIPEKHRDMNYRVANVCMASTAAPIFFPLSQQKNPDNPSNVHYFVDGGLWANNPVLVGLVEALMLAPPEREITVLSVGTCDRPSGDPFAVRNPSWGLIDWKVGVNAIDMSLTAQSVGYNSMAKFLAGILTECGRRVTVLRVEEGNKSPEQYSAIGLDRADQTALDTLVSLAEQDAAQIHSKTLSPDPGNTVMLTEIFKNLSVLDGE